MWCSMNQADFWNAQITMQLHAAEAFQVGRHHVDGDGHLCRGVLQRSMSLPMLALNC